MRFAWAWFEERDIDKCDWEFAGPFKKMTGKPAVLIPTCIIIPKQKSAEM